MLNKSIRPLAISTDLKEIANLLSVCFADSMDEDGERYIEYLRRFSQAMFFTKMAERNPEKYSLPGEGFIYEDKGKLVGNITLSRVKYQNEMIYLISNVAVWPEYRGKGIAKELTRTALQYIESKGVKQVWLQVKQQNQTAIDLYTQFDFQAFMTRTTWMRKVPNIYLKEPEELSLRKRKKDEWEIQKKLLEKIYPVELTTAYGFEIASIQPILRNVIKDVLRSRITTHCAAEIDQQVGFASYELFPEQSYVNLWIAVPGVLEKRFLKLLIPAVHERIGKEIRVNYPEKECENCFREIGMQELNTLQWMRKYLI
ncbi:MAG: GNAT family N-acetyltransferase [Anaerolineaceae bacterium]